MKAAPRSQSSTSHHHSPTNPTNNGSFADPSDWAHLHLQEPQQAGADDASPPGILGNHTARTSRQQPQQLTKSRNAVPYRTAHVGEGKKRYRGRTQPGQTRRRSGYDYPATAKKKRSAGRGRGWARRGQETSAAAADGAEARRVLLPSELPGPGFSACEITTTAGRYYCYCCRAPRTRPGPGPRARVVWRRKATSGHPSHTAAGSRRRGGGRAADRVLDDAVQDGRELARAGDVLPCDRWRGGGIMGKGMMEIKEREAVRGINKSGFVRYEDGEREGGFTLRDIARDEPAYTVRTVAARGGKEAGEATNQQVEEGGIEMACPLADDDEMAAGPAAYDDSGSDSDSGCECDFLIDIHHVEAEGWVPVLIPEDEGGDDWMSLTGSWMLMPAHREARKPVGGW